MSIQSIQEEIIEEFSVLDEWMDKYNYLIEMGREIPLIDDKYRKEEYLINGCQSRVWLQAEFQDGIVIYKADSDAIITKGIAALLIRVLGGRTPDEIILTELTFIEKIGLKEHLSPTRSNGLVSMLKQMRYYALAFRTKQLN
ncbi:MAG: SufE family protein [Bacteroidota bacterium]|nr:SufE family protein [Bacteroidota bacterium]